MKKNILSWQVLLLLLLLSFLFLLGGVFAYSQIFSQGVVAEEEIFPQSAQDLDPMGSDDFLKQIQEMSRPNEGISIQSTGQISEFKNLSYILGVMSQWGLDQVRYNWGETANHKTFIDINGDGLSDMLYHRNLSSVKSKTGQFSNFYLEVYLNSGGDGFEKVFECFNTLSGSLSNCNSSAYLFRDISKMPKYSANKKDDDKYFSLLDSLARSMSMSNITQGPQSLYTWLDVNGDGLQDFLYHSSYNRDVFLNMGNLNFDHVYRCWVNSSYNYSSGRYDLFTYSGDCAK